MSEYKAPVNTNQDGAATVDLRQNFADGWAAEVRLVVHEQPSTSAARLALAGRLRRTADALEASAAPEGSR